jgi:DIS3-like exonuclease 2|eukprot:Stramenopile-MAST_4_protein_2504
MTSKNDIARRGGGKGGRRQHYEQHIALEEAERGIVRGELFAGKLRISARNRREAYVSVDGLNIDVFLDGDKGRNRSLESDIVVLRLCDKSQWKERKPALPESQIKYAASTTLSTGNDSEAHALWHTRITPNLSETFSAYKKATIIDSTARAIEEIAKINNVCKVESLQPVGVVVCVYRRMHSSAHIGVMEPISSVPYGSPVSSGDKFIRFKPMDSRFPFTMVPKSQVPKTFLEKPEECKSRLYKVILEAEKWTTDCIFPLGTYSCKIGEAGDIETETRVLMEEFGFSRRGLNGDFDEEVHACLESFRLREKHAVDSDGGQADDTSYVDLGDSSSGWKIPQEEFKKRRDLRHYRIFTIDPASAKDLDDALHITPLENGNYEVGVHIADVSHFVKPGNALDTEASTRATTVYLVQKSLPMLPRLLSENLCSLNPNEERLAYSCIWVMSGNGEMVDTEPWYGRTIIRSCCKLDYGLAQNMIDGKVSSGDVECNTGAWPINRQPTGGHPAEGIIHDVRALHTVAMARRRRRFGSGSLALNQVKLCFKRDSDGRPSDLFSYPLKDSNRLVEEYMLLANYLVAEKIILGAGGLAPIRRHPIPPKNKLAELTQKILKRGISLNATTAGDLQKSLDKASKLGNDPHLKAVLTLMATVPMKPAVYFAAGTLEQSSWVHYALNIPYYTHFTSPIRRYADIMVHRVLTAVLQNEVHDLEYGIHEIQDILEHCNEKKTKSKEAQDRCDKMFFCLYIKDKDLIAEAVISDWGDKSFEVMLPQFGLSKRLHVNDLNCDMKISESSFILTPLAKHSEEGEVAEATVVPKVTSELVVAAKDVPLVDESRLKTVRRNPGEPIGALEDDLKNIILSQYDNGDDTTPDDLLPYFKRGADMPVFKVSGEDGKLREVPAEILGRENKNGIDVIYVRDLSGKKREMMVPNTNKNVACPSDGKHKARITNEKGRVQSDTDTGKSRGQKTHKQLGSSRRPFQKKNARSHRSNDEKKQKGVRNGKIAPGLLVETVELRMLTRLKVRIYFINRIPADFGLELLDIYEFDPLRKA